MNLMLTVLAIIFVAGFDLSAWFYFLIALAAAINFIDGMES